MPDPKFKKGDEVYFLLKKRLSGRYHVGKYHVVK